MSLRSGCWRPEVVKKKTSLKLEAISPLNRPHHGASVTAALPSHLHGPHIFTDYFKC